MKYIRSFLTAFCFIGFGVGGFLIGAVLFPLLYFFIPPRKRRIVFATIVHYSWKFFIWVMTSLMLIHVQTNNKEFLNKLRSTIVIANHPSLLDIVILISFVPRSICLVKRKLAHNILLKPLIKSIYLVNDTSAESFLENGTRALNEGLNVIIFPEGTRTDKHTQETKIHRGFAQLAIHSQKEVLMIKITSSPKILGKNQKWYDVGDRTTKYFVSVIGKISPQRDSSKSKHALSKEYVTKIRPIFN